MNSSLLVNYVPSNDCFAHINPKTLGFQSTKINCLKVSWDDKCNLLWCVQSHCKEGTLGLNSIFASRLGLKDGQTVHTAPWTLPPPLGKVSIHPDTEEDLEILECNAIQIQETLLNQMRVLEKDQKMVVWVSPSLTINITAADTGHIQQQTEVVVCFQNRKQTSLFGKECNENNALQKQLLENQIKFYMEKIKQKLSKFDGNDHRNIFGRIMLSNEISNSSYRNVFNTNQMFIIFIPNNIDFEEGIYNLKPMETFSENEQRNRYLNRSIFITAKKINQIAPTELQFVDKYIPIIINKSLSDLLGIGFGKKVVLERVENHSIDPEVIELSPEFKWSKIPSDDLLNDFKLFVTNNFSLDNPLLINNNCILSLLPHRNISCQITLYPSNVNFIKLHGEMFRKCKVTVNSEPVQPYDQITYSRIDIDDVCRTVDSFENIVKDCKNVFEYAIKRGSLNRSYLNKHHIMITGSPGSGKTSLCHAIVSDLGVWHTRLECRSIKGRKDILDQLSKVLQMCEEHSPSILICDDIETIVPKLSEEIPQQDVAFYEALVYGIRDLVKHCTGVYVLFTATSLDDIYEGFHMTKKDLLFLFHFSIRELVLLERLELLKYIINNSLYSTKHVKDIDYNCMAVETEGFTVRDLGDYVLKRVFKAVKKAASFRNKALELKSIVGDSDHITTKNEDNEIWSSVGGMKHITQSLIEILCWPLKYPVLFPKQPGGVLLFGPPGTGKSLIGSCISKLSQLSFICVKGPELLSKYIGQSEQAVRNLFEKAEKKKPCILFFDEFDSLAPRRGHDSTGVTDRVVNQLLTQLDGVEGAVKGVTVMAATSRPDLLDGALLRPGRFDTTLHCGIPTEDDRREIFQILAKNLKLSDDVNFAELADITEGFTGADIKSVLSTAQLQCLEEKIEALAKSENPSGDEAVVTREHILDALVNTRPSLTPQNLQFYHIIYSRFLNKPLTEEENLLQAGMSKRQRATLA